eukprot:TRINITY_DN3085_c0_g1_i2.p1 TRINITY_DN3085_c0_g1~~TRINITY_DN3085_c0_g1_i2.p1  ORF type:complete len:609 (-),score=71.44 TRINITY_DN3085_c0_g1_i2:671-2497(-)
MAKLLTMARFRCFPIFNKKNKHEIPRYVDQPQSLPMEFLTVDVSGKDSPDARKNTDREMLSNNAAHGDHKAVFIVGEKQLDLEDTNEIKSQPGSVLDHNQLNGRVEDDNFSFAPQLGKSGDDSPGMAYDGGDEEEAQPFNNRRVASSLDQPMFSKVEYAIPSNKIFPSRPMDSCDNVSEIKPELDCKYDEGMQEGHLSDPGFSKSEYLSPESVSPVFRRSKSVSKLEISGTRRLKKAEGKEVAYSTPLPPSNSQSYEDLQTLEGAQRGIRASQGSHCSEMTSCSADKVILKRGSSSKVLPSRARKLWWKIFLWSHRNLHKGSGVNENGHSHTFEAIQKQYNAAGGYSSDTLDMCREKLQKRQEDCGKSTPVGSVYDLRAGENVQTATGTRNIKQIDTVHTCRDPTSQSSNQWMAFSVDQSPMQRVQEWINSIDNSIMAENGRELQEDTDAKTQAADAETYETIVPEAYDKAATSFQESNMPEELQLANNAIRSLNAFSTVAHISGINLKVIPLLAPFTSLRTINLSANNIGRITPGALPKSLHVLDISRNKITAIEGLRELTRLRVLNLSYNKISRIGHGTYLFVSFCMQHCDFRGVIIALARFCRSG